DIGVQLAMGEAFDELGLLDQAVWTLEQARQKDPRHVPLNRALAKIYEKRGNFTQAMTLWEIIRKIKPTDLEAQHKAKDLAASATIAKGGYEKAIQANHAPATATPEETAPGTREMGVAETFSDNPAVRSPAEERCIREAAPLLARLQSDP